MKSRGYLAATLDAFGARNGMDVAQLAAWLGCATVDLAALRNQVCPDPATPRFDVDVQRLARANRCRGDRLRELLEDASIRAPNGCAQLVCPHDGSLRCRNCRQAYCPTHATLDGVYPYCGPCKRALCVKHQKLYRDSERTKARGMVCTAAGASLALPAMFFLRDYQTASLAMIAIGLTVAVVAAVIAYRAACESAYRRLLK